MQTKRHLTGTHWPDVQQATTQDLELMSCFVSPATTQDLELMSRSRPTISSRSGEVSNRPSAASEGLPISHIVIVRHMIEKQFKGQTFMFGPHNPYSDICLAIQAKYIQSSTRSHIQTVSTYIELGMAICIGVAELWFRHAIPRTFMRDH